MLGLSFIPMIWAAYLSFTDSNLISRGHFIGFANYVQFFQDPQLYTSFIHTLIYAVLTSGAKVILGFLLALLLTSPVVGRGYLRAVVFFPVLLSTIGVGILWKSLLDPFHGMVNAVLGFFGLPQPGWFTDPNLALYTIAGVDIWKGIGIATLIFMAGIVAIPNEYFEAAKIDPLCTLLLHGVLRAGQRAPVLCSCFAALVLVLGRPGKQLAGPAHQSVGDEPDPFARSDVGPHETFGAHIGEAEEILASSHPPVHGIGLDLKSGLAKQPHRARHMKGRCHQQPSFTICRFRDGLGEFGIFLGVAGKSLYRHSLPGNAEAFED